MNRLRFPLMGLLMASLCAWPGAPRARAQEPEPAPIRDLRIDPLLLVSVKEFRNIIKTIGPQIYPGWQANTVPLLLYRPLVQDVLLNAPHRPPGFARFTGHTALGNEVIYARNDSTAKDIDGQNTSMTLDSMRVLVVADQYSRERQHIEGTPGKLCPRRRLRANSFRSRACRRKNELRGSRLRRGTPAECTSDERCCFPRSSI
jgi:hypothetical protein